MGVTNGTKLVIESDYQVHLCTSSGTFLPYFTGNVEVLVVAGGGGGGMDMGGGGGGGGVLTSTTYAVTAGSPITVTIGAGGAGAPSGGPPQPWGHQFTTSATSGSNTVFGSLTAVGGGYGGSSYFGYTPNYGYGANGGSGGGASGYSDGNTGRNGSGTVGQGNAGGSSIGQYYSGGGGGAGSAGSNGGTPHGGNGVLNNILGGGKNYYWAGGGGGASYSSGTGGNGGLGGGGGGSPGGTANGLGDTNGLNPARNGGSGPGGNWTNVPGGDAGRNTGGGGGGGMHYNRSNRGGNGGSGVVVIRHLKSLGISSFNGLIENKDSLIFSMDAANLNKGLSVEVLLVAGGGGGGMDMGGGGGGGGVVTQHMQVTLDSPLVVTVGAGGSGSPGTYASSPAPGSTGGNSSIGNIVAYAGGGGGSGHTTGVYGTFYAGTSGNGGGAGGDSAYSGSGKGMGTDPIPSDRPQGYSGGSAKPYAYGAGGGGGAFRPGAAGRYADQQSGGNGGSGMLSSINGTGYYWGGGGGGASWDTTSGGSGGAGGGGGGSVYNGLTPGAGDTSGINAGGNGVAAINSNGGNGGTNTGGGGGGGTHAYSVGGNGGSGIVIVRYYGSQQATGGTITSSGGYTIHTFTSSGTFTPTGFTGIRDNTPSQNPLTLINITRSTTNGGILNFNGTSSYINLISNIQNGFTQASYEFLCNPSSLPGNSAYQQLYIQEDNTWIALYNVGGTVSFGIDLNNGSGWFDNNGGFNTGSRTTQTIVANNYYHVVYTWNGSLVKVYLNSVLQSTTSTLQASNGRQNVTQLGAGTTSRNIGSRYDGSSSNWVGSISVVNFYNKALSDNEVIQNFAALRGRYGI